ncbi:sulfite exporter TauE/SafE family protein [Corynebacterium sp.]|uniref:sulfite exporter TauE/SafE family protein n=1 Tax=Corynebacterium sp. TaxID=1720 RepID=UPI003B3BE2E5
MKLLLFAVAGLMAQLVDGALGMAFGVTATTMLILSGTAPAQASAAVHFAEVGTTLFSGIAHWRLNNVHWPTVVFLGIPGAVGAFIGATVLAGLSAESAEPVVSTLLLMLGAYVLVRSILVPWKKTAASDGAPASPSRRSRLGLVTLGLGGGFLDASGGGGWGPVTTSTLMSVGRSEPRKIIGTVNTAEFLVAVAASAGFIIGLDRVHESWQPVLGLLIGGLIGAPIAAWIVTVIKPDILGGIVGAVLVGLNGTRVSVSLGWTGVVLTALVVAVCLAAVVRGLRALRARRARRARGVEDDGEDDVTPEPADPVVIAVDTPR